MPFGRLLQFWIMTLVSICSLWAYGDYSVLHYRLSNKARLEAHFDSLPGDVPQIQFLLFHTDLEVPIVLEPKDPPFRFGHPMIDAKNRKFILPLPDNQEPLNLPEWAEIDLSDSWAWHKNLQTERMLVIGDRNSTGDFLHIFPIQKILLYRSFPTAVQNPTVFRLKEPRRLETYSYREYSMTYVSTGSNHFLLMSMQDKNNRNGTWDLGTMAVAPDGLMQFQSEKWEDLSEYDFKLVLDGDVHPSDGPPTKFKILPMSSRTLDNPWGRPIYTGKNVRSWQSEWPGARKNKWLFTGAAQGYWERVLGPIDWNGSIIGKTLRRIAREEYYKGNPLESYESFLRRQAIETQNRKQEQKVNEDLQVLEHFIKISGIEVDLKKMQMALVGVYKIQQIHQQYSSKKYVEKSFVLSAKIVASNNDSLEKPDSLKWMSWLVVLDQENKLLERRQLPSYLKGDDVVLYGEGNVRIRGTEYPSLLPPAPLSCIKAHPQK